MASELRDLVSCASAFDHALFCIGSRHQFDHYWRHGQFDGCKTAFQDVPDCLKIKYGNAETAKKLLKAYSSEPRSPTEGTVWQARPASDPGLK